MWSFPINSVVLISKLAVSRTSLTWFGSARDCHCWSYLTPQKFFGKSYTQGVLWKSIALQLVLCFDVKSLRRGTSGRSSGRSSDPVQSVVPFGSLWKLSSPAMAKSLMNINELWSTALPIFFFQVDRLLSRFIGRTVGMQTLSRGGGDLRGWGHHRWSVWYLRHWGHSGLYMAPLIFMTFKPCGLLFVKLNGSGVIGYWHSQSICQSWSIPGFWFGLSQSKLISSVHYWSMLWHVSSGVSRVNAMV